MIHLKSHMIKSTRELGVVIQIRVMSFLKKKKV